MSEPGARDPVATLRETLRAIEGQLSRGVLPPDGMEDLKSAVDDVRLRLWGVLTAGNPEDYRAFRERFRLRRATEICRGLAADLDGGQLAATHPELGELAIAAERLANQIRDARDRS
jgi:hypothetical protein